MVILVFFQRYVDPRTLIVLPHTFPTRRPSDLTELRLLRNWRESDAESFHVHTNTPAVMRWLGGVKSREDLREVSDRLMRWQEERGFTFWVVERKEDGAFLGFCRLKIADDPAGTITGE